MMTEKYRREQEKKKKKQVRFNSRLTVHHFNSHECQSPVTTDS